MTIGIGGGFSIPLAGMQDAAKRLDQSASRIAQSGTGSNEATPYQPDSVDLSQEAVEQKIATYDYKANLKALQAQDKMARQVIDIVA